jgi:hypothetical protein
VNKAVEKTFAEAEETAHSGPGKKLHVTYDIARQFPGYTDKDGASSRAAERIIHHIDDVLRHEYRHRSTFRVEPSISITGSCIGFGLCAKRAPVEMLTSISAIACSSVVGRTNIEGADAL